MKNIHENEFRFKYSYTGVNFTKKAAMKPKLSLIFSFLILLITNVSVAQESKTFSGTVTNIDSGEPVRGANVYFEQTTLGTSTGSDGVFEFSARLEGVHRLNFSFIGYETKTRIINFDDEQTRYTFTIELSPATFFLGEVHVADSNVEWQEQYREFESGFLGRTENARETRIDNRWVLDFSRNSKGSLIATAAEPLQVTNQALGYRIYIELNEFEWGVDGFTGRYKVNARFEELEPESRREERRWERARRNTWEGSLEHFLSSLYQNRLRQEHFTVYSLGTQIRSAPDEISEGEKQLALHARRIRDGSGDRFRGFALRRGMDVDHGRFDQRRSSIIPLHRDGLIFVDRFGNLLDPHSVEIAGEWSNHRIADMLPLDYRID